MTTIQNLQVQFNQVTEQYYAAARIKDWVAMKDLNEQASKIQEQIYYELYWKKGH